MTIVIIVLCVILLGISIFQSLEMRKMKSELTSSQREEEWQAEVRSSLVNKQDLEQKVNDSTKSILQNIEHSSAIQGERTSAQSQSTNAQLKMLQESTNNQLQQMQTVIARMEDSNNKQITQLKDSMNQGMKELKEETRQQMQEIKGTVDEQLQDTLDRKLKQSFDTVVKELTNVSKGLGEMSALASSVGDLKKTLTNVKTRGILGEMQLGAILEQILAPDQYATNVVTVSGTKNPVEYAIKLPGDGKNTVWLPIDSKFPADTYNNLQDAYELGNPAKIEECGKLLENRILQEAKDITTKYVHVPETTDFAIMFLPTEGLYAEVLRRGMMEKLQSKYKIMIAGPTTMAALLNSLYMGFRTLAVSQRANEVMGLLGNIKTEFNNYQSSVNAVYKRMNQTTEEFERLVGTRTRQLSKQLEKISSASAMTDGQKVISVLSKPVVDADDGEDVDLPFN